MSVGGSGYCRCNESSLTGAGNLKLQSPTPDADPGFWPGENGVLATVPTPKWIILPTAETFLLRHFEDILRVVTSRKPLHQYRSFCIFVAQIDSCKIVCCLLCVRTVFLIDFIQDFCCKIICASDRSRLNPPLCSPSRAQVSRSAMDQMFFGVQVIWIWEFEQNGHHIVAHVSFVVGFCPDCCDRVYPAVRVTSLLIPASVKCQNIPFCVPTPQRGTRDNTALGNWTVTQSNMQLLLAAMTEMQHGHCYVCRQSNWTWRLGRKSPQAFSNRLFVLSRISWSISHVRANYGQKYPQVPPIRNQILVTFFRINHIRIRRQIKSTALRILGTLVEFLAWVHPTMAEASALLLKDKGILSTPSVAHHTGGNPNHFIPFKLRPWHEMSNVCPLFSKSLGIDVDKALEEFQSAKRNWTEEDRVLSYVLLPRGHVTTGNLRDASSLGYASFLVGYFPDFCCCCLITQMSVWLPGHLLTL